MKTRLPSLINETEQTMVSAPTRQKKLKETLRKVIHKEQSVWDNNLMFSLSPGSRQKNNKQRQGIKKHPPFYLVPGKSTRLFLFRLSLPGVTPKVFL